MSARITVAMVEAMTEVAIDGPGYVSFYPSLHDCRRLLEVALSAEPGEAEGWRAPVDFYRVLKRFAEEDGSIREGRLTALSFALAAAPLPEDIAARTALESDNG